MKSHAQLLAEIEEKRLENKEIPSNLNELSIAGPNDPGGYDPYDNPSLGKIVRDSAEVAARRRAAQRKRRS